MSCGGGGGGKGRMTRCKGKDWTAEKGTARVEGKGEGDTEVLRKVLQKEGKE